MNLLHGLRTMIGAQAAAQPRDPSSEYWWGPAPDASAVSVTADSVVQIPEVFACLSVLAGTIAALPLVTYRRQADGAKVRDDRHPIAALLHHAPSEGVTAYELRYSLTWDLCLHRNAFAELIDGRRGVIDQIVRIAPEHVWIVKDGASWFYEVRREGEPVRRLSRERVMHMRAPPIAGDGILGRSLIVDGRRVFTRALALQDYATRFFENDATPSGIILLPGTWKSAEEARLFREKWMRQFTGKGRHGPAVLDGNAKFESVPIQHDKAQFLETYKEVALQILRLWRMPPHKIGNLERATFSNIEQQSIEFVSDTLMPWIVCWEQSIRRDLLLAPEAYVVEHNVAGLLRGDLAARYSSYAIGRQWGWLSVNDIRRLENMNPVPAGDGYLQPLNMVPAGAPPARLPDDRTPEDREAVEREITLATDAIRRLDAEDLEPTP
jgi:HK97 family phage portal protein